MRIKEQSVDKRITKELNNLGCWWHKNQGNLYQKSGRPDFEACINGRTYGIEAKAGNGHPLKMNQLFEGYRLYRSGGVFIVAFNDYESLFKIKPQRFTFNLDESKITSLSNQDYQKLESLYVTINHARQSVRFQKDI